MEITISSRQVLLPEFAWFHGLLMQAGCPDLEILLFSKCFCPGGAGSYLPQRALCFPGPSVGKGRRICLACALPGMVMPMLPAHSPASRTLRTLDFKPFRGFDLICSKCCCLMRGENSSRNSFAMAAKKQQKLQNKQNLQGPGSRIDFRNSALLSDKKNCPRR